MFKCFTFIIIIFRCLCKSFYVNGVPFTFKLTKGKNQFTPLFLNVSYDFDSKMYPTKIDLSANITNIGNISCTPKDTNIVDMYIYPALHIPKCSVKFVPVEFDDSKSSIFPLGRKISKKNSIINIFKESRNIGVERFFIEIENEDGNSYFYLGGSQNSFLFSNKYFSRIKVDDKNDKEWNIRLNHIFIGDTSNFDYHISPEGNKDYVINDVNPNNILKIDQTIYFTLEKDYIYVPRFFFKYLEENIFKEFIAKKVCSISLLDISITGFICSEEARRYVPNINFIFGKVNLVLSSKDKLFIKDIFVGENNRNIRCLIVNDSSKEKWVFGGGFLSNYIAFFDYEEDSVGFFSYDKKETVTVEVNFNDKEKNNKEKVLEDSRVNKIYLYLSIILVVTSLFNIVIKKKLK